MSNIDCNVDVVKYLLSKRLKYGINHRRQARKLKWKSIYKIARLFTRFKISSSGILFELANDSGSTPIHYAAQRGDLEMIELLMEHGALTEIRNDMNRDTLVLCESFPEVRDAIMRTRNQDNTAGTTKHSQTSSGTGFELQRRQSIATSSKYGMYLIKVSKILKLFGNDETLKQNINLCHQDLLRNQELVRFEDLPMGAFILFVSHQWSSYSHPDPHGYQIKVLCKVIRNLRDGVFHKIQTEPIHVLLYVVARSARCSSASARARSARISTLFFTYSEYLTRITCIILTLATLVFSRLSTFFFTYMEYFTRITLVFERKT